MPDMSFEDPLGRHIVLHERTWYGHVVKGHPDLASHRSLVEVAISNPEEIRHSTSDPDCRIYYGRGPRESVLIAVVVDVRIGIVKTVYLAKKPGAGDTEWSSQTP